MDLLLAFFTSISVVLAGTLQIMDHEDRCFVYSTEIFDCTGISEPFAPLNGTSCSNLITARNDTKSESDTVKVNLCISSGHSAWVEVYRNGLLYFDNDGGDEASCKVDKALQKGSLCTADSSSWTLMPSKSPLPTPFEAASSRVSVAPTVPTAILSNSSFSSSTVDC